jgi:hypothetical protein
MQGLFSRKFAIYIAESPPLENHKAGELMKTYKRQWRSRLTVSKLVTKSTSCLLTAKRRQSPFENALVGFG